MYRMQQEQEFSQTENEFRNIKLKLKGPNRHSELQAVKALMAMSAQHNVCLPLAYGNNSQRDDSGAPNQNGRHSSKATSCLHQAQTKEKSTTSHLGELLAQTTSVASGATVENFNKSNATDERDLFGECDSSERVALDLSSSQSESPEPIYGLSITMTEDEFRELAEREGIKDVIGEPICRLCNRLFSGPLGIALHMCPAMKRQTYKCEICGEDKWKTKANLHSHIKWCKKRVSTKTDQDNSKQIYP